MSERPDTGEWGPEVRTRYQDLINAQNKDGASHHAQTGVLLNMNNNNVRTSLYCSVKDMGSPSGTGRATSSPQSGVPRFGDAADECGAEPRHH
jgi:hypothetical protein